MKLQKKKKQYTCRVSCQEAAFFYFYLFISLDIASVPAQLGVEQCGFFSSIPGENLGDVETGITRQPERRRVVEARGRNLFFFSRSAELPLQGAGSAISQSSTSQLSALLTDNNCHNQGHYFLFNEHTMC